MGGRDRSDGRKTRGQTTVDFVVAMSVFLAAVGFAFAFVPQVFAPFDDERSGSLAADRAADQLAGTVLRESAAPARLNRTCTIRFFDGSDATACPGFDPTRTLATQVGVSSNYAVAVTLERDVDRDGETEVLCTDGASIRPCADGGTPLAVGDGPPRNVAVATAHRVVHVDGADARLVVSLW